MAAVDDIAKKIAESMIQMSGSPAGGRTPGDGAYGDGKAEDDEALLTFNDGMQRKLITREDASEVAMAIEYASKITALELKNNSVGIEGGKRIAEALRGHPELKRALWSDMFTGRLKTETPIILDSLCKAMIETNVRLTELDLSDNALGPVGVEGIKEFLRSPSSFMLQTLKLNNDGLGGGGVVVARCLSECHKASLRAGTPLRLRVFVGGRNRLENPGAKAFAKVFKKIKTLEEVSMPQNGICYEGIAALARAFWHNPHLRVIDLNDNTLTSRGAAAISSVLYRLPKLEILNLGDCLCRNRGSIDIAYNLKDHTHTHLKELNLSSNEITADAALTIMDTLANRSQLQLILDSNNFADGFQHVEQTGKRMAAKVQVGDIEDDQGELEEPEEDFGEEGDERAAVEEGEYSSGSESDDEATEEHSPTESAAGDDTHAALKNGYTHAQIDNEQSFHAFVTNPSLTALEALGHDPGKILLAHLQEDLSDKDLGQTSEVLWCLTSCLTESNKSEALKLVVPFADRILQEAQEISPSTATGRILGNMLTILEGSGERQDDIYGLVKMICELVRLGHFRRHFGLLKTTFKTHGSVWLAYPRNASAMSELTNQIRLLECIGLPDKIKALVQKVKNDE